MIEGEEIVYFNDIKDEDLLEQLEEIGKFRLEDWI